MKKRRCKGEEKMKICLGLGEVGDERKETYLPVFRVFVFPFFDIPTFALHPFTTLFSTFPSPSSLSRYFSSSFTSFPTTDHPPTPATPTNSSPYSLDPPVTAKYVNTQTTTGPSPPLILFICTFPPHSCSCTDHRDIFLVVL